MASLLLQLFALAVPALTGAVVDRVVPRGDGQLLLVLGAGIIGLVVFQFLASLVRSHLLLRLRTLLDARMSLGYLEHLMALPYAFLSQRSAGDLMMRLNSNATVRETLSSAALSGALDGLLVVLYLGILSAASWKMGLLVLALAGLQVLLFLATQKKQRQLMAESLGSESRSQAYQVELFTGLETLKSMGAEQQAVTHWSDLFVDVLNNSLRRGQLDALIEATLGALRLGSPLLLLGAGAAMVMSGELSLRTMLGLNALAAGFLLPLGNLLSTATQLLRVGSYIDRLDDIVRAPREQDRGATRPARRLSGRIELERVSFRYGALAPLAVTGASVSIEPGQRVAIVGRSGAGKTTLARLLLALYRPDAGRILYDGEDLAQLDLGSVRRQIGVVPQSPALFGSTVRHNIALGDPEVDLSAVIEAAKLAGVHDEIAAMPMGYETVLFDRGLSLSGGSGSASRSRERWCASRASCCSTRRRARSTRSPRRTSTARSPRCAARAS